MDKVIAFGLGATIGSIVTWKLVEKKYKEIIEEEIAFGIKRLKNMDKDTKDDDKEEKVEKDKFAEDKVIYNTIARDSGYYNDYTVIADQEEENNDDDERIEPFVINPVEYGEEDGYETKSWTYYADFVLTDDDDQMISDPESVIGDALSHFGDYEDDSVYVRNDNLKCDYEILKSEKTFSEINGGE